MNLQQERDMKWMLKFNGYKTTDNIKYVKANNIVARSVEFGENNRVLIKYLNTESKFFDRKEVDISDGFNWI
jgi:hypothetical protein